MFSDFQYCSLIHVNSPTCMISFDRIILNHLDLLTQLHTFAKLSNIPCLRTRQRMNESIPGYDPKLHWMWKSWIWKSRKYPKIWKCQLKKVGMIHSSCTTIFRKKNGKTCPSRWQICKSKTYPEFQPAAHLSFDLFSRNPRSCTGCFESASMVWEKAGGLQKLEIIYQTMGQICTTLTKLNFGHESCMVYQCLIPGRKWGPF